MAGLYEWNPVPHRLAIQCPICRSLAEFEFATYRRIKRREHIAYFKANKAFDYRQYVDGCGHKWHAALYYPGLHGPLQSGIHDLPDGYEPQFWAQSHYWRSSPGSGMGSVRCSACFFRSKHQLNWPHDLYFLISYRGHNLWAYDRDSAVALRNFIHSETRSVHPHGYSRFLLHVPSVFKHHKAREPLVKALDKKLYSK